MLEPFDTSLLEGRLANSNDESCFSFAGFDFVCVGDVPDRQALRRDFNLSLGDKTESGYRVHLSYEQREGESLQDRSVRVDWNQQRVDSRQCVARIRDLGTCFVAAVEGDSFEHALELAGAAALDRLGGVILHGSAVLDDDGRAHVFIGPSGAGKSTAVRLSGRPFFASDRVAILRSRSGEWLASRWPGGKPEDWSGVTTNVEAPLAGIWRVTQGEADCRFARSSGARALTHLREACLRAHSSPETERELESRLLTTLFQLAADHVVGEVVTVLNRALPLPQNHVQTPHTESRER